MPVHPLLGRSLLSGATGAVVGGTVGAALGAATAKPEQRKEQAKKWGVRGAVSGGLGGLVSPAYRAAQGHFVGKLVSNTEKELAALGTAFEAAGSAGDLDMATQLVERMPALSKQLVEAQKQHQALLVPVPPLEVARQATIGGGLGASVPLAVSRISDFLKARLSSRSASPPSTSATAVTPAEKTASRMLTSRGHSAARVTLGKYANDPLAPDKGEPLQYETAQDRKARRVAELLKKSMPTGTAEGSASPTPKRGTP